MWPFLAALVALLLFAAYVRDARMVGTATVLLLNWAACSAYVGWTGDAYPWPIFAAIDYASGFAVLALIRWPDRPVTLWQVAVGVIYAAQLVAHGARGLSDSPAAIYYGWYFLSYAAWAQCVVVGTWGVYELVSRSRVSRGGAPTRRIGLGRATSIAAGDPLPPRR